MRAALGLLWQRRMETELRGPLLAPVPHTLIPVLPLAGWIQRWQ